MLEVSKKISPKGWMLVPAAHNIMGVLNNKEDVQSTLFVGGCVRNLLLNQPVEDLDIATTYTPDIVQELCAQAGFKTFPTGIEHGTITVIAEGQSFEVTTLRQDVETDGRRATISYTTSWRQDAMRRDFTMNTLLADINGNIYDPLGTGLSALEQKQIVFVGNPHDRIKEDYLRILRFFRFHAYYGDGEPDGMALKACRDLSENISKLSRERISQEFFKIMSSEKGVETLELMRKLNVLEEIIPQNLEQLEILCRRQIQHNLNHLMARIFVLTLCESQIEERFSTYLLFTNRQTRVLKELRNTLQKWPYKSIKELIYREGHEVAEQVILIMEEEGRLKQNLEVVETWNVPNFPINGHDAKSLDIPENKEMGKFLQKVEDWWIEQDFQPTKSDLIDYMKSLIR